MKKIIAIIATVVICLLIAVGITIGLEYINNQNIKYEKRSYEASASTNLTFTCDVANINYVVVDSQKFVFEYSVSEKLIYTFQESTDEVIVTSTFSNYWFSNLTLNKNDVFDLKITGPSANLKINLKTGTINLDGYKSNEVSIDTNTADINIDNSAIDALTITNKTGDIDIVNSQINNVNFDSTTSDIKFENTTGDNIYIEVTTGDVDFTGVSFKTYNIDGTTCDLDFVGQIKESFTCTVTTGDVDLLVDGNQEDFSLSGKTTIGNVSFDEKKDGIYSIVLKSTTGDLKVAFSK